MVNSRLTAEPLRRYAHSHKSVPQSSRNEPVEPAWGSARHASPPEPGARRRLDTPASSSFRGGVRRGEPRHRLGIALRRHPSVDRPLPASGAACLGTPSGQDRRPVGLAGPRSHGARLRAVDGDPCSRPYGAPRIHPLHPPAARPVHGRRRHSRARQHPRRAGHQHDPARDRHRARQLHRHHGRVHGDDPSGHARQRRSAAQRSRDRLLHLPGVEYRRLAHAARRSAALPRLPARRGFLLDHHAPAARDAFRERASACALLRGRPGDLQKGRTRPARSDSRQSGAHHRRHQPRPDPRHHRRHPHERHHRSRPCQPCSASRSSSPMRCAISS